MFQLCNRLPVSAEVDSRGGDNAVIYIVYHLGEAVSNFSLAPSKDSLKNTLSSGVRILLDESDRKPSFNWLKP